jgi:hypothetical protein
MIEKYINKDWTEKPVNDNNENVAKLKELKKQYEDCKTTLQMNIDQYIAEIRKLIIMCFSNDDSFKSDFQRMRKIETAELPILSEMRSRKILFMNQIDVRLRDVEIKNAKDETVDFDEVSSVVTTAFSYAFSDIQKLYLEKKEEYENIFKSTEKTKFIPFVNPKKF